MVQVVERDYFQMWTALLHNSGQLQETVDHSGHPDWMNTEVFIKMTDNCTVLIHYRNTNNLLYTLSEDNMTFICYDWSIIY